VRAVFAIDILFVCLSVHPSIKCVVCDKTVWKIDASSFPTGRMVGGGRTFYLKFWLNWPNPFNNGDFQLIFAHITSALTLSEKSLIMTNRKYAMCFPTSLRYTAYVASKPPEGAEKHSDHWWYEADICQIKSAREFLCVKTFSGKIVRHLLAYLTVHKQLVEDIALNANFVCKLGAARCTSSLSGNMMHTLFVSRWLQYSVKFITVPIS